MSATHQYEAYADRNPLHQLVLEAPFVKHHHAKEYPQTQAYPSHPKGQNQNLNSHHCQTYGEHNHNNAKLCTNFFLLVTGLAINSPNLAGTGLRQKALFVFDPTPVSIPTKNHKNKI